MAKKKGKPEQKMKKVVSEQRRTEQELMHWAWTVIANAYGGNWSRAKPEWKDAAMSWRDAYHAYLEAHPLLPEMEEVVVEVDPSKL